MVAKTDLQIKQKQPPTNDINFPEELSKHRNVSLVLSWTVYIKQTHQTTQQNKLIQKCRQVFFFKRADDAYFVGEIYTLKDLLCLILCWEKISFDRQVF